jgi:hypothetical protein
MAPTGQHRLTPEEAQAFEIGMLRTDLNAQPADIQRETLARVRSILRAEADSPRVQHSELWRRARDVYGIDPNKLA